jgi:hypothetical protein
VRNSIAALLVIVVFSSVGLAQTGSQDLSGIWAFGGLRTLSNAPPPMTPAAQAKFNANKPSYGPRAIPPALGNDPAGRCDPLGLVRLMLFPRPLEILQVPGRVLQFFEWNHMWRTIWTDGRKLPEDPDPRWFGYSVGRWEADTFIVNSLGFDDRTWLDQFGNPYSDEMRLEERWRRVGDTLELTMTLTDPKTYTKPWVSEKKVFRPQPKEEIREEICVPSIEEEFNRRTRNPAAGLPVK